MNTQITRAGLIMTLLYAGTIIHAAEGLKLESTVYVFKNSEVAPVEIPPSAESGASASTSFGSPATVRLGGATLSIDGENAVWSGGGDPPDKLSRIGTPSMPLAPGKPVSLLFSAPVQYLEKVADGSLQVREIAADSPDAPHWRLTFTLRSASGSGILLGCDVTVASVGSRESLPGVAFPVGKPVLSHFAESLEMPFVQGQWTVLLVRPPQQGDLSMLTLLKLVPDTAAGRAAERQEPMTAQEFAVFSTYYYRDPQPEGIAHAIESLAANHFLDSSGMRYSRQYQKRAAIAVGFFAKVFQLNPSLVPEWKALIERRGQDADVKYWLRKALRLSQAGSDPGRASNNTDNLDTNDLSWGAFMASGDAGYIRRLVDQFALVDSPTFNSFLSGADAMTMLAFQAPHHPQVLQVLEKAREETSGRTHELLNDLLTKGYAPVQLQLSEMWPEFRSPYPDYSLTTNPTGIPLPPPPKFP